MFQPFQSQILKWSHPACNKTILKTFFVENWKFIVLFTFDKMKTDKKMEKWSKFSTFFIKKIFVTLDELKKRVDQEKDTVF